MSRKLKPYACAVLFAALAAVLAFPQHAAAQDAAQDADDPPGRVARLSYLQGSVSFQPAGESDWALATINRPMTTGDKLWADEGSRAELHLGSAAIRLDSNTGFSFLNLDDRTVQIQLSAGTLYIRVRHLDRDEIFEVDTPNQAFSILRAGEYRFEASEDGNSTVIAIRDGEGEAEGSDRTYTVEHGERATLTGTDSLSADIEKFDKRDRDDFDGWCESRDQRDEHSRSARYVSPDVVGYEDLDDNGVWQHDAEYGEIWIPTAIPAGWAPYHYGHWAWIAPWGWTWVDDAAWGYAPFHYGRWAYTRRGWGWIPGPMGVRPVYAPALVAFVGTPNFTVGIGVGGGDGAVAWFPLGPREVYVPSYEVSREYVNRVNVSNTTVNSTTVTNVYNTTIVNNNTQVTRINYVNRTAPGAVTEVPENAFRGAEPVDRVAVHVDERRLKEAPVIPRAQVAPTRDSLVGAAERKGGMPAPPRAIVDRPVVAKTAPPRPPVPFERQAPALAAHPGQPLRHDEAETLRPVNSESAHPMVRQELGRERAGDRGRPGEPDRGAPGAIANRPTNAAPAEMPQNGPRNDRPLSTQPEYRGRSDQPHGEPRFEPAKGQPGYVQPDDGVERETGQPVRPASAPSNMPTRNDRPSSAQPQPEGREFNPPRGNPNQGNRPQEQPSYRPTPAQAPEQQGNRPDSLPVRELRSNPEPPSAPANRGESAPVPEPRREATPNPPQAQPIYRPTPARTFEQQGNRPTAVPSPAEQRSNPQPQNTPANRGFSAPPREPRREVMPNPPRPAEPAAAAPRPAPPAPAPPQARNESRPQERPASVAQPPANKGGNSPAHGNKDDKKKN